MVTRRGLGALGLGFLGSALASAVMASPRQDTPLKVRAERRGLSFGSEIIARELDQADLLDAMIREVDMLVPGIEMKWGASQPKPGPPDFGPADRIADFAARNGMRMRGHTAIWYRNFPKWAEKAIAGPQGKSVLDERITSLLGHFKGRVAEWDVVNEEIEPKDGRDDLRRASPFLKAFGPDYLADAFRLAHETDPDARLFYNDYGVEYDHRGQPERRDGVLRLLSGLRDAGAPVHGFGIQAHLITTLKFDPKVFRDFLREVADLGLSISITELDINDYAERGGVEERDRISAEHMKRFLDVALDEKAVRTVMLWGLSDRDSWLNTFSPRKDGTQHRPSPYDAEMRRKPLWDAVASALDHAPDRS